MTGREWKGTAFGGWKSRQDVPKLVNKVLLKELDISQFITHTLDSLHKVNESIDILHSGQCLRAVVKIHEIPAALQQKKLTVKVESSTKLFGGSLKLVSHWSEACQCTMKFNIYLPEDDIT